MDLHLLRLNCRNELSCQKTKKKHKKIAKTQIIEAIKINSFYLNIVSLISIVVFTKSRIVILHD